MASRHTSSQAPLQPTNAVIHSMVRIAEFSVAVTVVDHVGVRFPQSWGLMEAISEACGISV